MLRFLCMSCEVKGFQGKSVALRCAFDRKVACLLARIKAFVVCDGAPAGVASHLRTTYC